MPRKKFEPWEEAFIYLNNPLFSHKYIGDYLGRSKGSIQLFLWHKKLTKKDYFLTINIGDRFGSLTIIKEADVRKRHKYYICECDCGNKTCVRSASLNSENTKTCGKCNKKSERFEVERVYNFEVKKNVGFITRQWYNRFLNNAIRRNIEFTITMDFLNDLFIKQEKKCPYTLLELDITGNRSGVGSTASIDRKESSKGYTEDNVQIIHIDINRMKFDLSNDRFLYLYKLVAINKCD